MTRLLIALHALDGGGVARVTSHVAQGLAQSHEVILALASGAGQLRRPDGVRIAPLQGRALPGGLRLLARAPALTKLIRNERPAWVIAPGNRTHLLVLRAVAGLKRSSGKPRVALKFTNPVERTRPGAIPNWLRRAAFRRAAHQADLMMFLSQAALDAARALLPRGARAQLVLVTNPYVDPALLDRPARSPREGTPKLISVGRLVPQKDQAMMLDALARLKDRDWTLSLLGDGPLRRALKDKAKALGLRKRIRFAGFVSDPRRDYDEARLFLLSSRYEELPAVLFEALAARVPIVTTAASQAIVDLFADHATITPPGDAEAFADAIAAALDGPALAPDASALLAAHSIAAGVASHAAALGLDRND